MSQFTINTILGVLRLLMAVLSKATRLIAVIADLVDDGCVNSSVPRPRWYDMLESAIGTIEDIIGHFNAAESELLNPSENG